MEQVSELMSSRKYVALKVVKESLEYNQFSQLCILIHVYVIHFVCHYQLLKNAWLA